MSKSKDSDSDVDIYEDLPNFSADNTIAELENAKKRLENELRALKAKLKEMQIKHDKLEKENEALSINISSLYKTAACEIKRKDQMIQELRKEKDSILFRRHRKETQNYHRRGSQANEVLVIEDNQPAAEKVFVIEDNNQYDNTTHQHTGDMQYGEPEVIASFPEEGVEDDCAVQEICKKGPDTIFSRRKAQQLKLINKKSDSFKDSTIVEVRPEQPVIIIEDSDEIRSTTSDKRKTQLPTFNAQHVVSEDAVQASYGSKDTPSIISAETKSLDLNNKRIELSTNKHASSFRRTSEVNIKSSSKENESSTAPLKARQNLRTEDLSNCRTKSYHKIKEHSRADKTHSEKYSHAVSEDAVQANVTPSYASTDTASIISAETKTLDLNTRRTDISTNKHTSSLRKNTEANIKSSSKENESSTAPLKAKQSLTTEDLSNCRTKSYKIKEHSRADKTYSEKDSHAVSEDAVQANVTPSYASTDTSSISAETKSLDLNRRIDISTNKHASSLRKNTEATIKSSSKENESSTAPLKVRQSFRTEDVKDTRTKSYRKIKEHSEADKTRSEKHSHASGKDRRSVSDVSSHRKSSSSSRSKYSSHKSPLKKCYSPKASKSRSIRETSVSRALKSLRSRSHLKESEHKISRRKEVEIHGSKRGETQENKKKEQTIEESSVPKLPTEISTDLKEDVPMKPKIVASDTAKAMIIVDLRATSDVSKDSCTTTNNHNKKQDKLQQKSQEPNEKEEDRVHTDMAVGSDQNVSQKEKGENIAGEITLRGKEISELQKCSESNSDMTTERHSDNGALDKQGSNEMLAETQVLQKDISEEPQGNALSLNKSISHTPMDIDLSPKKVSSEFPVTNTEVIANVLIANEQPLREVVNEKSAEEDKSINEKDVDSSQQGVSELESEHCANEVPSVESGTSLRSSLLHEAPQVDSTSIPLKSQMCVEMNTDAKHTTDKAEDVQASTKSNLDEVTKKVADYPAVEENNASSLCNKEQRSLKSSHLAVIGSKSDCSTHASETFLESEPADRSRDITVSAQILSNEEKDITSEILNKESVSGQCLVNNTDVNSSLVEPVNESLSNEKELTKPANQAQHNSNESLSPTAIFTHGNGSFTVVNEHGCFRRRKLKRISIENITVASNVTEKTSDVQKEKVSSTKRAHEHTGSSESPPAKKQALEDPHKNILHLSASKDKSTVESSIQAEVTETNASNDKHNTSDLEEGEIEEDDDDDERDSKKVNSEVHRSKVSKSVIHRESNVRKEQPRKYLDLGRKARENRRKSHGSHLQEMSKGSRDKRPLPSKLFSHCKRRSPSELLIKDRNIKGGTKEKEKDSRSRSTSSETHKNTNERLKEVSKERYRSKENASREEKKEKAATSNINKTVLQNMHVNKQKDISATVQVRNHSSNDGDNVQSSRKEHSTVQSRSPSSGDSFKVPITSSQTSTPITRYVVKRRNVCNLRDSGSFPVVNISPPTPQTNNSNAAESFKSVQLNSNATPKSSQFLKKTNISPHSKEKALSKTQPSLNSSKISSPNSKSLAKSYSQSQVSSESSASSSSSSSSSSEYENNSDETWNPKGRRRKRTRKNPKTEVTKSKTEERSF